MNIDFSEIIRSETGPMRALVEWLVVSELERDRVAITSRFPVVTHVGMGVTEDHEAVYLVTLPLVFDVNGPTPHALVGLPVGSRHRGLRLLPVPPGHNDVYKEMTTAEETLWAYESDTFEDVVRTKAGERVWGRDGRDRNPTFRLLCRCVLGT